MASARAISIQTLVALLVLLPVLIVATVLVVLTSSVSRRIAEDLGRTVVESATSGVSAQVRDFLSGAVRVSDLYARRIHASTLPTDSLVRWEQTMLDDLVTSSDVESICFADSNGSTTWLLRNAGRLEVGRVDGAHVDQAQEFVMSPDGTVGTDALRTYTYEALKRPWYQAAVGERGPIWTPVYKWFADATGETPLGTGYTRPIYSTDGSLRGVLVVDVTLGSLSAYLKSLRLSSVGHVFIVDEEGRLVAASHGGLTSAAGERLTLQSSTNEAARAAAPVVSSAAAARDERVVLASGPARVSTAALAPFRGIAWRVVTVIPESAFLAEAKSAQNRSVVLACAAGMAGLFLGVSAARRISRPVVKLSDHVAKVGAGDFDARIELRGARELEQLATDVNTMAAALKDRVELEKAMAVAREVQQSLLPLTDPSIPGLAIAGRSQSCDAAGGDYFDFVTVNTPTGPRTIVAIADVMGHGIAAALLMATARAALRAHAPDEPVFSRLMQKVNRVLATDNRHQRFVTMTILSIEPSTGEVRWASAGHDPAIVYHPSEDRFEELEGADIPLGLDADAEYEQFRSPAARPGAFVVLGTDGIWESRNSQGELFGKERLKELMRLNHASTPAEFGAELEKVLKEFRGPESAHDDITFVAIKIG